MPNRDVQPLTDPTQIASERLAKEVGQVHRKEHDGLLSVALVYPNTYAVAMSNLGFQKVYQLFNRRSDTVCERAFLPSPGENTFLRKSHKRLFTLESQTPLHEFDVVAFSITFEEDYINVLEILELAGIPLNGRGPGDPLVVIGGICPSLNPEILGDFVDLVIIGEAEPVVDIFCETLIENGPDKKLLANKTGFFVPSGYEPVYEQDGSLWRFVVSEGFPSRVERRWNFNFADETAVSYIETEESVFGDMSLVEVGKGCGKHCRFCAVGYVYRPTRYGDIVTLFEKIDEAIDRKGKVGLVGSAIADHPDVEWLFDHIVSRGALFSVSSLRLDRLTERMLTSLVEGGCHTITVAPEAGSERLRKVVNKEMSDETIMHAIRCIASTYQFNIKLYFLVGLPEETDEDVAAIVDLVKRMQKAMVEASRRRGSIGEIIVSVDCFVPKPNTPFQWNRFAGVKENKKKLAAVVKGLRSTPNVTVKTGSARSSFVQAALSVGDRRMGAVIERARQLGGDWFAAFAESKEHGFDPGDVVRHGRKKGVVLPWSIIDTGLHLNYLAVESKKAEKGRITEECPPPGEACNRCGSFNDYCLNSR